MTAPMGNKIKTMSATNGNKCDIIDNSTYCRLFRMNGFIYKITSPTGRVYIGQAVDLKKRLSKYKSMGCSGQKRLYLSFVKYGVESHKFESIEEVPLELLNIREAFWQQHFDVLSKKGLNCKIQGHDGKSGRLSEETKRKISEAHKGKKFSEETLRKMSQAKIGKKMPEDQRLKMIGRKLSSEHVEKIRARMIGNSHTKGITPVNSRKVIDDDSGIIYESLVKAAKAIGMKTSTLRAQLDGVNRNKTTLRYL